MHVFEHPIDIHVLVEPSYVLTVVCMPQEGSCSLHGEKWFGSQYFVQDVRDLRGDVRLRKQPCHATWRATAPFLDSNESQQHTGALCIEGGDLCIAEFNACVFDTSIRFSAHRYALDARTSTASFQEVSDDSHCVTRRRVNT